MMSLYRVALAALILAVPASASVAADKKPAAKPAKPAAKPATRPAPATPLNIAQKQGFGIIQLAADDSNKFINAWKIGAGAQASTTRAVANQPLYTFLIFRGCKADPAGNCDLVADFVIHRPDGTVNEDNKGITIWNKAAPADATKPILGDGALGYGVDDEGPFGDYRVVVTVTDKVANVSVTTEETLTITAAAPVPEAK
jgi:hypothetical protein